MRRPAERALISFAVCIAAAAACDASDGASFLRGGPGSNDGANSGSGGAGLATPGVNADAGIPPEQEEESVFRVPVVSGRWVWAANPETGRVAIIDATSYEVATVEAGLGPTYLAALPAPANGGSAALVINVGSQDANLLLADDAGNTSASPPIPIHSDANAWAVTESGQFAIAWTDARTAPNADPTEGFQDLTVIDLRDPAAIVARRLTVGFRPTRVFLDADDDRAYVVTDPGISVIELAEVGGPLVDRDVALSDDPANDTAQREVVMTPDGAYALVRREGSPKITVVTMESGDRIDVELPGPVTDLDLSADASFAVAVVRAPLGGAAGDPDGGTPGDGGLGGGEAGDGGEPGGGSGGVGAGGADSDGGSSAGNGGQASTGAGGAAGGDGGSEAPTESRVVVLPVPEIAATPTTFDAVTIDEVIGSVSLSGDGVRAMLYTNAVASAHLTLLDTSAGSSYLSHRTVNLQVPVYAVIPALDGAHAIALLQPQAGSSKPGAFAVVPVATNLPAKIQGTVAPTAPTAPTAAAPARVAIGDRRAVVTVTDHMNTHAAYLVRMPELVVDKIALSSEPLPSAVGIVPDANKAFVAQRHPEGRITFIDLETGEPRTMTGFELSATVTNGN